MHRVSLKYLWINVAVSPHLAPQHVKKPFLACKAPIVSRMFLAPYALLTFSFSNLSNASPCSTCFFGWMCHHTAAYELFCLTLWQPDQISKIYKNSHLGLHTCSLSLFRLESKTCCSENAPLCLFDVIFVFRAFNNLYFSKSYEITKNISLPN